MRYESSKRLVVSMALGEVENESEYVAGWLSPRKFKRSKLIDRLKPSKFTTRSRDFDFSLAGWRRIRFSAIIM